MGPSNWVTLLSPAVAGGAFLQSDASSGTQGFCSRIVARLGLGLICSQAAGWSRFSPARTPQAQEGLGRGCPQAPLTASAGRGAPSRLSQESLSKRTEASASSLWGFPPTICPKCQSIYKTQRRSFPENTEHLERTSMCSIRGLFGSSESRLLPT